MWVLCLGGGDPDEDPEDPYTQISDDIRGKSYLPMYGQQTHFFLVMQQYIMGHQLVPAYRHFHPGHFTHYQKKNSTCNSSQELQVGTIYYRAIIFLTNSKQDF